MRNTLPPAQVHEKAVQQMLSFHPQGVQKIETAIQSNDWVIVGMALNPFVIKAKALLTKQNIAFQYIEFGGYTSKWKERLAIKLWSGWPTFPLVFYKGVLLGGFTELKDHFKQSNL